MLVLAWLNQPSLGARQAPRNFRGQNMKNEKVLDISTEGPVVAHGGP